MERDLPSATVGVIGGSGFYSLLEDADEVGVDTPWGEPSDVLSVGEVSGRRVAFVPRHGRRHTIPPHRINNRANLWALRHLGVERVIAPCATGSLRAALKPGTVVVCDQFIDRTSGRADTFFEGPAVAHVSGADPYCPEMRPLAVGAAGDAGLPVHDGGTVVVVNGPRFGTRAEGRMHATLGGDVVSMTQYPEVILARELGMCYAALALVTDHDSGVEGDPGVRPVTQEVVFETFRRSLDGVRDCVLRLVRALPESRGCTCNEVPGRLDHEEAR